MPKNRTLLYLILLTTLCIMAPGCKSSEEAMPNREILFQYSTLGSLLEGVYDGEMTCSDLKDHGDFGLGTFNALDGEMVVIDHEIYQIKADGVAYQVAGDTKIPFAAVTYFEPDETVPVEEMMDCEQMKSHLDSVLPTKNIPYAVRIDGTFEYIKTRSVPAQTKPYPPLLDVLETQPTFEFHDVEGVIVGFRLPGYVEGANAPGYHFHFVNEDRDAGGHVLACQAQGVDIEIDLTNEWHTVLPEDSAFYDVQMSGDQYQ